MGIMIGQVVYYRLYLLAGMHRGRLRAVLNGWDAQARYTGYIYGLEWIGHVLCGVPLPVYKDD